MKTSEIAQLYSEYVLPTYSRLPIALVRGRGSRVWDIEGKEYLDFFPGWAVSGLGHCHPSVVNAIKTQAKKILHVPNNFLIPKQALLAQKITEASFSSKVFFCNSGAEAVEGAIKVARKFGASSGRYEIITMKRSFHGRTMGALTATGQSKIHSGFEPLVEGFKYAELNDLDSVKKLITSKTVAVLLEPIQGEGGIQVASEEFMKGLKALCVENKMLLMVDEIQAGMGRTGKMFAYQHYEGLQPDVMVLAKSLGNGVPIGAFVVSDRLPADLMGPGSHGSTYGGNPLVAAAALAVFKTIQSENLLQNAQDMGSYLEEKLRQLQKKFQCIVKITGKGLMRGLELNRSGAEIADRARDNGLIINCTQGNILRILPAINVKKTQINKAIKILDQSFAEVVG